MQIGQPFNPRGLFHFIAIPLFVSRRTTLNSSAKLVYGQLLRYCGENGMVYPSQSTLAAELGMSEANVRKSVDQLVGENLIAVESPNGSDRLKHFHNRYVFLWSEGMEDAIVANRSAPDNAPERTRVRSDAHPGSSASKEMEDIKENILSAVKPPTEREHPRWKKMAQMLAIAIQGVRKVNCTSSVTAWAKHFYQLHVQRNISPKRIKAALRWYCQQLPIRHGEKYFLVIHSGETFKTKFDQLEDAIRRDILEYDESGDDGAEPVRSTVTTTQGPAMSDAEFEKFLEGT